MMPGMSGLELLTRIHEQDADIICIMITGYATVELATQAVKQGAYAFLPKPFSTDELLTAVERGIKERGLRLDAKEQKNQEEESLLLERARKDIAALEAIESRFMLVIVHELRNPAGVIKNYLQLMRAGYVDDDEWDDYLEKLDLRATQLLDMLDDLLELANLKKGAPSDISPVAAAEILEGVIQQLQPAADSKGLSIEMQIQALPTLSVQKAHLQSLWKNLIDNAIRYTPKGKICVTLAEENGQVITTVDDTGIGISTEEMTRIFQEFYRSDAAKAEHGIGTGLGLAIVEQIVKIYEGTIQVDSVPGEGSTFTIALPT
jgi:two-component system phosphate regulon sensor histidine kinase PhoR